MSRMPGCAAAALVVLTLCACGAKETAVGGVLLDWNDGAVPGATMTAMQVHPVAGYAQLEAETDASGAFRITGLYPNADYILRPKSELWTCGDAATVRMRSPGRGEMLTLPDPVVIPRAYAKDSGAAVHDLATGATRFVVTEEGVIQDSATGLEWVEGPNTDTPFYAQAEACVGAFNAHMGDDTILVRHDGTIEVRDRRWRMPTKDELAGLYQKGLGERNLDPVFKMNGWWVWAEPHDETTAWRFTFSKGTTDHIDKESAGAPGGRAFAVRVQE